MVRDGILTDVLIEDTQDSTKLSRHSENAVENNMVLRCQASVQAAMKDEYKIFNVSGTKRDGCWHWPAGWQGRQSERKLTEHKNLK